MINLEIFWLFLKVGFIGFGGLISALPLVEQIVVNEKNWLDHNMFVSCFMLGNFTPGPISSFSLIVGYKVNGASGLLAALLGTILAPFIQVAILFYFLSKERFLLYFKKFEIMLRPTIIGLMLGALVRIWIKSFAFDYQPLSHRAMSIVVMAFGLFLYHKKVVSIYLLTIYLTLGWWISIIFLALISEKELSVFSFFY